MIAVNQTRSQVEEISRDKKHHSQITSYEIHALMREFYQVTNVQMVE